MTNQATFDYLKECGCCDICCLRYLKARGNEYKDLNQSFEKLKIEIQNNSECIKKLKNNPCPTCLGFFETSFRDVLIDKIVNTTNIDEYDCPDVVINISLPMIIQSRQLSMWFALIEKFGASFGSKFNEELPPDVPVKEAVKLIINPTICEKLKKTYDANGTQINIFLSHSDESKEIEKLLQVDALVFQNQNAKGRKKQPITRGYLEKNYIPSKVPSNIFAEYIEVPPAIPDSTLTLDSISITGPIVFVAGRYRKISRELSHSPWVLQGKRIMEDSIQEIIIRSVAKHFGVPEDTIVFSSSGREDVDVRCLGKGRPFVLEIPNSKRVQLPQTLAAEIESEIEKSLKVSVRNLQMVKREDLVHIKTGEEKKKKFYRALCILKEPATVEILEKLNIPDGFEVQQITPLRVLHRRPLHTRPRRIYSVKAHVDKTNHKVLILDIVSQAGTYIKELVHGEFGRTSPSLHSIIGGQWIDIMALDVIGIDLDWPKEIDNRSCL